MLDAIFFEKRGIPAAVVITQPFVPTAHGIAEMAGMPGYPHAAIPHPVGSLAAADVRARADAIAGRVAALLLGTAAGRPIAPDRENSPVPVTPESGDPHPGGSRR